MADPELGQLTLNRQRAELPVWCPCRHARQADQCHVCAPRRLCVLRVVSEATAGGRTLAPEEEVSG
jgi:hypothetical protein